MDAPVSVLIDRNYIFGGLWGNIEHSLSRLPIEESDAFLMALLHAIAKQKSEGRPNATRILQPVA